MVRSVNLIKISALSHGTGACCQHPQYTSWAVTGRGVMVSRPLLPLPYREGVENNDVGIAYLPSPGDVADLRCMRYKEHLSGSVFRDIPFTDEFDIDEGFDDIEFDFSDINNDQKADPFPKDFEDLLHALPLRDMCNTRELALDEALKTKTRRSQARVKHFLDRTARGQGPMSPPSSPMTTAPQSISDGAQRYIDSFRGIQCWVNVDTPNSPEFPHARKDWDYLPFKADMNHGSVKYGMRGILHDVWPQENIWGWQRISFMKYPLDPEDPNADASGHPTTHTIDENHFAYEGVVLPGGKMIFGRWWSPLEQREDEHVTGDDRAYLNDYPKDLEMSEQEWEASKRMTCTGPFMMWCVD